MAIPILQHKMVMTFRVVAAMCSRFWVISALLVFYECTASLGTTTVASSVWCLLISTSMGFTVMLWVARLPQSIIMSSPILCCEGEVHVLLRRASTLDVIFPGAFSMPFLSVQDATDRGYEVFPYDSASFTAGMLRQ